MASRFSLEAIFKATDMITKPLTKMGLSSKRFSQTLKTDFATAQRQVMRFNEGFKNFMRRGIMIGSALAAAGFTLAIKTMVTEAAKLENIVTDFKVLTGSLETAKNLVTELRMLSAETPLQFEGIAASAKMLMAFGIQTEKVRDTIKMLGDAALGDQEKLMSLTRAYGKVMAQGKVSMKEMNMVTNAQVPIMQTLADQLTGGNIMALRKLVGQNKVTSQMFHNAFVKMTSDGGKFYKGMIEKSKTLSGLWSTFKDIISIIAGNLGDNLLPILKEYLKKLIEIGMKTIDWIKNNKELIKAKFDLYVKRIVKTIITFYKVMKFLYTILKPIAPLILTMIASFWAYKITMFIAAFATAIFGASLNALPIFAIITAISLLVIAVVFLIKHWEQITAWTKKWWNELVKLWDIMKGLALFFGAFGMPIVMTIEIIRSLIKHWNAVKEAFKSEGIVGGLLAIGKAILYGIISPIKSLFDLLTKIPKIGKKFEGISTGLGEFQSGLFEGKAEAPMTPSERSALIREEKISRGEVIIKDETGKAKMTKTPKSNAFGITMQKSAEWKH